jgi:hypothetical protein
LIRADWSPFGGSVRLAELLEKAGEGDFPRAVAEAVLQLLMEIDVEGLIGAGRYERNGERTTWRNGHRDRTLTRLGALQRRIPKLRQGSYFPPFLEARKSSEKALIAVIQEARIGVQSILIDENPMDKVAVGSKIESTRQPYSVEQVTLILNRAQHQTDDIFLPLVSQAYSGCRVPGAGFRVPGFGDRRLLHARF